MGKKLFGLMAAGFLLLLGAADVHAETSYGNPDWSVTFTEEKKMVSNFKTSDLDEAIYGLQPGDNAILTLKLKNENSTATDWYMTNKVLYSLEDRSKNSATGGGAYTYVLEYKDKNGKVNTLFRSDTIGGEKKSAAGEGLHAATNALEDYFYVDTFAKGQGGEVTLEVALDGETQGNDYQNTLADLQMNFAVELNEASVSPRSPRNLVREVRTGDDSNLTPFILAASISGILLFFLSIYGKMEQKKQKKKGNVTALLLLFFLLLLPSGSVFAQEGEYTYTVRIFSGAQGTISGSEIVTNENLHYGDRVTFRQNSVQLKDNSKYYVKGIRESGRDNNTANSAYSFPVTGDQDYVVVYGILGDSVAYTVKYQDASGKDLAPAETYYGNVGDEPVVAYLYIEGYQPQAYNLTGKLSENASENVFTFTYTPVSGATQTPAPSAGGGGTTVVPAAGGGTAAAGGGAAAEGGGTPGNADNPEGEENAPGGEEIPDDQVPRELETIGDEETPLASFKDLGGDIFPKEFAVLMFNLPVAAKAGIFSMAVLAGAGGWYLLKFRKKRKKQHE